MSLETEQLRFYRDHVVQQFNRTLERQREAARSDANDARLLEEMEAVRASIVVRVDLGEQIERYCYDIERGMMRVVEQAVQPPFLVLDHKLESWPGLRRACGDSLLGFLGAIAGQGDEMRLTAQRVRSLRELGGELVLEQPGAEGFSLSARFGAPATGGWDADDRSDPDAPHLPQATIRIDANTFAQLREGALDPQDAFLEGRIEVKGDEGMAIGLALAAASPG